MDTSTMEGTVFIGGLLMLLIPFHGFCMALADSVPGVSGGTVAFILVFYDRFIKTPCTICSDGTAPPVRPLFSIF